MKFFLVIQFKTLLLLIILLISNPSFSQLLCIYHTPLGFKNYGNNTVIDYICLCQMIQRHISSQRFFRLKIKMSSPIFFLLSYRSATKIAYIHTHHRKKSCSLLFTFIGSFHHPKPLSHKIKSWSPTVCSGDFELFNNIRLRTWNNIYFFLIILSLVQGYQKHNF